MRKFYYLGFKPLFLWHSTLLLAMLPAVLATSLPVSAADSVELKISGTLRKTTCQLHPDDQTIMVDLQTINSRDLELAPTPTKEFLVRLQNCDVNAKEAKVTIDGRPASGNSGQLALDGSSAAQGFAIGFKQGKAPSMVDLPLGVPSSALPLNSGGDTQLYFGAYAQKLPGSTLTMGSFQATATLKIDYL